MRLKLADFGLALHLKNQNNAGKNHQHIRWCAPECLYINGIGICDFNIDQFTTAIFPETSGVIFLVIDR